MQKQRGPKYPLDEKILETRGFRPEIQGLRALAVLLVVMYHVWFGRVSGGVDVFLFISAFLLSLSSMRKINEGKPLAVVHYWFHVFQRLLPAASVVIALTLVASYFILAPSRWMSIIEDAIATLFYYLNWHLAFGAVDYYAQNASAKTPFQHFWSLSMQGQIFITWPLLFALVALLTRKLRLNIWGTAGLVFGSIWLTSFIFSIIETYSNQGFAYFDTRTRLWEFALGTLLAILTFKWTPPQWARVPMGWIGIFGLVTCGFLLPVEQAFPGYLALWPLLSGALVILAGRTGHPLGVDRILTSKPLLKLGESSYALYLVHWPILTLYAVWAGKQHVNALEGTIIIASSIALAYLLHTFVEKPARKITGKKGKYAPRRLANSIPWTVNLKPRSSWAAPVATILTCLLLVGTPLFAAKAWVANRDQQMIELSTQAGTDRFPGALVAGEDPGRYRFPPIPTTDPVLQFDGFSQPCDGEYSTINPDLVGYCSYDNYGGENAPLTIIVGDSHAEQAISMYRPIAQETQQQVAAYLLGGCRFPDVGSPEPECASFNANMVQEVIDQHPENVLVMLTAAHPVTNAEHKIPGIEEVIQQFNAAGINVIGLRDNPRFVEDMYECAQMNTGNPAECSAPVEQKLAEQNPALGLVEESPGVYGLDLTAVYCPNGTCESIIGNVYVYIDNNHISKAYGSTTAEEAYAQLAEQGWDPAVRASLPPAQGEGSEMAPPGQFPVDPLEPPLAPDTEQTDDSFSAV